MRLNLFFKDATIKEIHRYEFEIKFDISNMRKPVLSENSRMYIENVNLCEFRDSPMGEELGGFLQLRCDDIDSEYNYSSDPDNDNVIYQSSLKSFNNFQNNDPMKTYNFKIRKSFLSSSLTFNLQIFDLKGSPFTNFPSIQKIYVSDANLIAYNNEIQAGFVLFNKQNILENVIEDNNKKLNILNSVYQNIEPNFKSSEKNLIDALEDRKNRTSDILNILKIQYIIEIIKSKASKNIIFLLLKVK